MNGRLLTGLGAVWLLLLSGLALGDEAKKDKEKDKDEYGPWTVKVPGELRGKGYSLRIDGDLVRLSDKEITLKGEDYRERIELVDGAGRVLSDETAYVDQYIFDFVHNRTWRVNLLFGNAAVNGNAMHRLLQDTSLSETDIDLDWQPGPLGLRVSYADQTSDESHSYANTSGAKVTSTYNSYQWRLMAVHESAPFAASGGALKRLHVDLAAGLFTAEHKIEIGDDVVTIRDEDSATGAVLNLDLMYPIHAFWLEIRGFASYQKVEFKTFKFHEPLVERGALIGGGYAF